MILVVTMMMMMMMMMMMIPIAVDASKNRLYCRSWSGGVVTSSSSPSSSSSLLFFLFVPPHRFLIRRTTHRILPQRFFQPPVLLPLPSQLQLSPDNDDDDDATTDASQSPDLDSVSDAEAVLACYAYLQRKNLLSEWSTTSRNTGSAATQPDHVRYSSGSGSSSSNDHHVPPDETMGYFWENLSELRYYNRNHYNNAVYRPQSQDLQGNDTATAVSNHSTRFFHQKPSPNYTNMTTATSPPVLTSIEGTEYNYIENFVPGMTDNLDDRHSMLVSTSVDPAVVAEVVATRMTTSELRLQQQQQHHHHHHQRNHPFVPIESTSRPISNEQLPMYVHHPNTVWDIMEEDEFGNNDIDTPMYRKNYRLPNDPTNDHDNNEWDDDRNNYHQNDDDTLEVLRFQRRSNRTKDLFHNATWKEAWYARRWGSDRPGSTTRRRHQMMLNRRLQEKILSSNRRHHRSTSTGSTRTLPAFATSPMTTTTTTISSSHTNVPMDNHHLLPSTATSLLLHSQLISRLEEHVIADAIVTYIEANRKRSMCRKVTNQHRQAFLLQNYDTIVAGLTNQDRRTDASPGNRTDAADNRATVSPLSSPLPLSQQSVHHYHPIDSHTLSEEERQRQRCETAQRAYQTRLENEKRRHHQQRRNDMGLTTYPTPSLPIPNYTAAFDARSSGTSALTPTAARDRINCFLSVLLNDTAETTMSSRTRTIPVVTLWNNVDQLQLFQRDVELVVDPRKLPQRKELLLRIMRDLFQLRGMCVPICHSMSPTTGPTPSPHESSSSSDASGRPSQDSSRTAADYKFMTKASVSELGSYILQRIKDRIIDLCPQ